MEHRTSSSILRHPTRWWSAIACLLFVGACSGGKSDPHGPIMQQGLDLLYKSQDAAAAVGVFRVVLSRNPSHYGAHYQLAVALDRSGRPAEARPAWERVSRLAQATSDSATLATALARLAARDTVSEAAIQAGMMKVGMDLLTRGTMDDAEAAAAQFTAVLHRNPTHYGATYQLAESFDRLGQRAAAEPLWQRVLTMALKYGDEAALRKASQRLKR